MLFDCAFNSVVYWYFSGVGLVVICFGFNVVLTWLLVWDFAVWFGCLGWGICDLYCIVVVVGCVWVLFVLLLFRFVLVRLFWLFILCWLGFGSCDVLVVMVGACLSGGWLVCCGFVLWFWCDRFRWVVWV